MVDKCSYQIKHCNKGKENNCFKSTEERTDAIKSLQNTCIRFISIRR